MSKLEPYQRDAVSAHIFAAFDVADFLEAHYEIEPTHAELNELLKRYRLARARALEVCPDHDETDK